MPSRLPFCRQVRFPRRACGPAIIPSSPPGLPSDENHRHGARLDAADKQWHLSSPTPYDPPLTYGGWQQAKSLGVRIGSILRERVKAEELAASQNADPSAKRKRKRFAVVLHSSPFLRCIQTSIAISAGLAQDSTPFETAPSSPCGALLLASDTTARPKPTVITDMRDAGTPSSARNIRRSVLRLDGFLGEWLSPSYFELITPPPGSVMMLASAKADLLRREDYSHYAPFSSHSHSHSQSQLWSPISRASPGLPPSDNQSNGLGNMSSLANSLPRSGSVSSQSSQSSQGQRQQPEATGYVSPVPHYAVNTNCSIPPGYVAHARDACVDIDYQWDSTRSPLDWGDGGSFPEEWAAMHKRFRTGLQRLVDWYSTAENPTEMVTKTPGRDASKQAGNATLDANDDVEIEPVVVLVSHGAGCNALIGAITHQPALMDVGIASLTMAVRKPEEAWKTGNTKWPDPLSPGNFRDTPPVHEIYDLKLFANTDHLRSPGPTPASPRAPSSPSVVNGTRGRHSSISALPYGFSWHDGPGSKNSWVSAALNSVRGDSNTNDGPSAPRLPLSSNTGGGGITIGSGVTSFGAARPSNLGRTTTLGLWSPASSREEEDEDEEDNMVLNFSHEKTTASKPEPSNGNGSTASAAAAPEPAREEKSVTDSGGVAATGPDQGSATPTPSGLWGGPRPPDDADRMRDRSGSKRRWTVNERS